MKTVGIIAEYNPFHNGHKYHLKKAKELTGTEYAVVIMSGDYTQRGAPAIYSKYMRTRTALLAGADLVLEMPVFGTVASAPDFAMCGVSGLSASGICDFLFFGSECGNIKQLKTQANFLGNETEEISSAIKNGLKCGLTWPQARAAAYQKVSEDDISPSSPNDILGIEYIRAIETLNSPLMPVTLKRTDPGYHSTDQSGSFASATAARKAIIEGNMDFLTEVMPDEFFACLQNLNCPPISYHDFSILLNDKILTSFMEQLLRTAGMPEPLARKLFKNRLNFRSADEWISDSKDRQYTYTRVSRSLMNLTLGITKDDVQTFKEMNHVPWLRILGFRKDAAPLLSALKKNTAAPTITKTAHASSILSGDALRLFEKHLMTAETYRLVCQLKIGRSIKNEYTRSVVIV